MKAEASKAAPEVGTMNEIEVMRQLQRARKCPVGLRSSRTSDISWFEQLSMMPDFLFEPYSNFAVFLRMAYAYIDCDWIAFLMIDTMR